MAHDTSRRRPGVRRWLLPGGLVLSSACSHAATAAIATSGQVIPTYTGADPWTISSNQVLVVGNDGLGSMTQTGGSEVISDNSWIGLDPGSNGAVTVTGPGSVWRNSILDLGRGGVGGLVVEAGGVLENTNDLSIGRDTGSDGSVLVTGAGSQITSGFMFVGFRGHGTLSIQDGAVASQTTGRDAIIGLLPGSTGSATVTCTNSQWDVGDDLVVGFDGTGELNIEAGGMVSSRLAILGREQGSTGTATISGAGSSLTVDTDLIIGANNGTGVMRISDGGVVTVGGETVISPQGTLMIDGGELLPTNAVRFDGGTYHKVTSGPSDPHLTVGEGLTIGPGSTLTIELAAGYTPALGDTISLFNTGSNELMPFDQLDAPTLDGALGWRQAVLPSGLGNRLVLSVVLPADLSGDGDIDDEDLGLFFSAFTGPGNGPTTHPLADLSGDGDVDDEDLGLAFSTFTGPLAPINVPEPATAALLAWVGFWAGRRGSKRP